MVDSVKKFSELEEAVYDSEHDAYIPFIQEQGLDENNEALPILNRKLNLKDIPIFPIKYPKKVIGVSSDGSSFELKDAVLNIGVGQGLKVNTTDKTNPIIELGEGKIGGGHTVGEIFFTSRNSSDINGAYKCDGREFLQTDFVASSYDPYTLLLEGSLPSVSYEEYQTQIDTNGICGVFALDTENGKFKIPTLNNLVIKAGDNQGTISDSISSGSGIKVVEYVAMVQLSTDTTEVSVEDLKKQLTDTTNSEIERIQDVSQESENLIEQKTQEGIQNLSASSNALTKNDMSNCFTSITQNVIFKEVNRSLYLISGTRLYDGNGFLRQIDTDKIIFPTSLEDDKTYFIIINEQDKFLYVDKNNVGDVFSIPTEEIAGKEFVYCSEDKKCYRWDGTSWIGGSSLPLGTYDTATGYIDEVFNNFGYISKYIFSLPSKKFLIPNGLNSDGSLNNLEVEISDFKIFEADLINTESYEKDYFCSIDENGEFELYRYYFIQENWPLYTNRADFLWFNNRDNFMYDYYDRQVKNRILAFGYSSINNQINRITYNSNMRIPDFQQILFELYGKANTDLSKVSSAGTDFISTQGKPNVSKYENLSLGASGQKYVAPANGWVLFSKRGSQTNQYNQISTGAWNFVSYVNGGSSEASVFCPVTKGDDFTIYYLTDGSLVTFKFIYDMGVV